MSDRGGQPPEETGLSLRLERLLQDYSAKLDSLELTLPAVGAAPEPPPAYLYKDYFPDVPAPPPKPAAAPDVPIREVQKGEPVAASSPLELAPAAVPVAQTPTILAETPPAYPPAPVVPRPEKNPTPVARPLDPRASNLGGEWALRAGLALAAAAAFFGLWRAASFVAQTPHHFFSLKSQHLAGLVGSGASLFVDDGGRLVEIAADGGARDAGILSGGPALGLARDDGGHFWTSVEGQEVLYEHDTDGPRSVRKAYPYPNRRFAQVAITGDTLWALDGETGAAYQYMLSRSLLGTSLTPISQFTGAPETARAAGLAVAQGLLWVCDPAQRRLLRYRPEGPRLAPVDALDLSPWVAPGSRVTGMTLAGGYLWVLTGWPAGIHRLRLDGLSWRKL